MRNMPQRYNVDNLKQVDTSLYKDGDMFITTKTIGILHNGTIKPLFPATKKKGVKKDD